MAGGWFVPTLGYVVALGLLGITSRYALRQITWQGLLVFTTLGYVMVLLAVLIKRPPFLTNTPGSNAGLDWTMASIGAFLPSLAIIALYIALERGEASRVIPVSSAYPLLTILLAGIFLSEPLTWQVAAGGTLVVAGVVLLSS